MFRCLALVAALMSAPAWAQERDFSLLYRALLIGTAEERGEAVSFFRDRGKLDIMPSLVQIIRIGGAHREVTALASELAGEPIGDWRDAMLWQEANPQITPHPSFYDLKLRYWASIDREFLTFFDIPVQPDAMRIRFEEIAWGGVVVDGIPSLDNPTLLDAAQAEYLLKDDLVFGVEINGDARAYPLRIMGWHEMFNEEIGGVPVALAYCTLCGAGILFETQVEGRAAPFVFGSSGFLYRSNKLMFDRETRSLWNQFTGEPVSGPLVDSGIKLTIRPVAITSWEEWVAQHPQTKVLSLDTGHFRDYRSGVVYRDYFNSPDLMFPTTVDQSRLLQKDYVFGIRAAGGAKAWALDAFEAEPVINDRVGLTDVVLVGDPDTRTVRAYERKGRTFAAGKGGRVTGPGGAWQIEEAALVGPEGTRLPRVPGHIAYWFAWDGYLGAQSALYLGKGKRP